MKRLIAVALLFLIGCGPTSQQNKERAFSEMNVIAKEWNGGPVPPDLEGRLDPWGQSYQASIERTDYDYKIIVKSSGPDKLPENHDDISVYRRVRHNDREKTISQLNAIADEWDGKATPPDLKGRTDLWGVPLNAVVVKEAVNYKLKVVSAGPDKQLSNSDDIFVLKRVPHGESSDNLENEKFMRSIFHGIFGGARDGVTGKEPKK